MKTFVAKEVRASNYSELIEEQIKLDEVEITVSDKGVASFKFKDPNSDGVFVKELKDKKGVKYHVTIVIDTIKKPEGEKVTEEDLMKERVLFNFDIQDYRNYYIANRADNTVYLLYVLTETTISHLYDLGQKKVKGEYVDDYSIIRVMSKTVVDEKAGLFKKLTGRQYVTKVLHYLPDSTKVDEELKYTELKASRFDEENYQYYSSGWSKEVSKEATTEIDGVEYKAAPKLGVIDNTGKEIQTINKMLKVVYTYEKVETVNFEAKVINKSLVEFINGYYNGIVAFDSDWFTLVISLISFLVFLFVPPFFSLFAWLFTRRTGMPKYKNYFNIMSIVQIPAALIMFVSGWFINLLYHSWIIIVALLLMIWYYIFVIYQINSKIAKANEESDDDNISGGSSKKEEKKEKQKPVFKKLKDDSSVIG